MSYFDKFDGNGEKDTDHAFYKDQRGNRKTTGAGRAFAWKLVAFAGVAGFMYYQFSSYSIGG
ncbi:hypothetical protein [Salinicola aestuarinus]|uniref:hypothetical protein n=1 Tax=Salinicola aestuarinus TaxID=1949082 RepID=UPI0013006DDE|nr:hypothetical protein [Salinicola aestuarinus]